MNIRKPSVEDVKYKVYDRNGILKRKIEKLCEKDNITNADWLKGVSCFVVNENNEILIEKRVGRGLTPGKLDLCSGHIDNSEIPTQAMIRELKEELGIEIDEAVNVRKLPTPSAPLNFGSKEHKKNFFIDFFCLKRKNSNVIPQEEEVEEILWIPMEQVFELIKNGKTKFPKDYNYEKIFEAVRDICIGNKKQENDIIMK